MQEGYALAGVSLKAACVLSAVERVAQTCIHTYICSHLVRPQLTEVGIGAPGRAEHRAGTERVAGCPRVGVGHGRGQAWLGAGGRLALDSGRALVSGEAGGQRTARRETSTLPAHE